MTQLWLLFSVLLVAVLLSPALSVCNLRACQDKLPGNGTVEEQCASAKEAITCGVSTLLNNPDCTENIRMLVRKKVEEGRKEVQRLCGGGAGLLASLVVCLGLSVLTHFATWFQSRTS